MNTISHYYNLELLRQRNKAAFTKLYLEYKNKIYIYLLLKSNGDKYIAEEVLCDTFHSAFKSAPKLKNTVNIKNWIFRIASRRLSDYFRKLYKEKNIIGDFDIETENIAENFCLTDSIIISHKKILINQVLNNLKDTYKNIIELKYIENKSIKEISSIMNKNLTSVNNILQRARVSFKKEFEKIKKAGY
jgi:RNA polymerase sigma-70 factor, ECF subfamily